MKTKVFKGIEEVEIRKENSLVVVVPITDDPMLQLGKRPVNDAANNASSNHDQYFYGK